METRKSYYAIIPADVRYDTELTPNAKLLYGEITALCNEKGYCWASNNYFAELYEVKKETVSRWISLLEKKGYIKTILMYKENSKEVKNRHIYMTSTPIDKIINTPSQNNQYPIDKIINTPIDKIVKDNNTLLNNTSNNTLDKDTSTTTTLSQDNIDSLINKWNELDLQQLRSINKNTNRHTMLRARVKEYGLDDVFKAISNVGTSSFLRGQNKKGWTITFDWLVKPNNFIKVLEGNYTDKDKEATYARADSQSSGNGKQTITAEQAGVLSF